MRIAILGAGNVGVALAGHALRHGHIVRFGVRDVTADSVHKARAACADAVFASMEAALREADMVFLALPWTAALTTVEMLSDGLVGKTVVDCTNAYDTSNGFVQPAAFPSAATVLRGKAPGTNWVKAFN